MRITRHKAFKKSLRFYKAAYDYVDPYHVIIHPSFIDSAVTGKINLKDDLSNLLAGRVTPMVTECIMRHLRKNGRTNTQALLTGKACFRLKCGHDDKYTMTPSDCTISQLGKDNPRHFLVAAQDDDVKASARRIPGTPVMSIHGNLLMLESPSEESRLTAEHRDIKRRLPKLWEERVLEESSSDEDNPSANPEVKKKKKKKKSGPNPLSCKKRIQKESVVVVSEKTKRVRTKRESIARQNK